MFQNHISLGGKAGILYDHLVFGIDMNINIRQSVISIDEIIRDLSKIVWIVCLASLVQILLSKGVRMS